MSRKGTLFSWGPSCWGDGVGNHAGIWPGESDALRRSAAALNTSKENKLASSKAAATLSVSRPHTLPRERLLVDQAADRFLVDQAADRFRAIERTRIYEGHFTVRKGGMAAVGSFINPPFSLKP
jgi:hypothetical protein